MSRKFLAPFMAFLVFFSLAQKSLAEDNPIRVMFEQAGDAMNKGEYQRAADIYQKIVDIVPNFAAGYHFLALAKKELGAPPEEIIGLFEKATEKDPQYMPAIESLAKIYYTFGDYDKAVEFGNKAVQLAPDNVSSRLALGWTYLLGKDSAIEALAHFDVALSKEHNSYGYYGWGLANFKVGKRGKVLEAITELRNLGDEDKAKSLEEMLRTGEYRPPMAAAQIATQNQRLLTDFPPDFENQPTSFDASSRAVNVRLYDPGMMF